MRILLDYRPALRQRTGVGEFVHELSRALARTGTDDISVMTASWKDRPAPGLADQLGVRVVDWRIPVRTLTWCWNRMAWPPVEWLAGAADVVHSQSPLIIPSTGAASVTTIHDLHFLTHPERSEGEIRRDFPELVRTHSDLADHIVVSSHYAAGDVTARLNVPRAKVSVCSPGAPEWAASIAQARADRPAPVDETVILFLGTLEPRKNIRTLLDAYAQLVTRRPEAPPLVLAGGMRASVASDMKRIQAPPLAGRVHLPGYVSETERRQLYRRARMLVLPSLEEGFGFPVLEAMACGVPVVVSNRGSLPEVVGDASVPIEPLDAAALAASMERLVDAPAARAATGRGLVRAASYSWTRCAAAARDAYSAAVEARRSRRA